MVRIAEPHRSHRASASFAPPEHDWRITEADRAPAEGRLAQRFFDRADLLVPQQLAVRTLRFREVCAFSSRFYGPSRWVTRPLEVGPATRATHSGAVFEFGRYRLDARSRQRLRLGAPVALSVRQFDPLLALVAAGGSLVPSNTVIEVPWQGVAVGDSSFEKVILQVRRLPRVVRVRYLRGISHDDERRGPSHLQTGLLRPENTIDHDSGGDDLHRGCRR